MPLDFEGFLAKVKSDGFKGQYWDNMMDLEIYIRKTVQAQAKK